MSSRDVQRLEAFLTRRFGFRIPPGIEFKRMPQRILEEWLEREDTAGSKIIGLSMNDFLTDKCTFNPFIENVVAETIQKEELTIYAGIVSYDRRGEAALVTGGNTFNNLKAMEEQGLITRFLSYQGDRRTPSPLCRFALNEGIKVWFVDDVEVHDRTKERILDRRSRGKTENVLKFLLMLREDIRASGRDPDKTFVLFLDDDYCLLDERAHYILIASWVLSFAASGARGARRLGRICRDVGFVKNGGVRIHFPRFLAQRILRGEVIKNYRSLLIEAIRLDLDLAKSDAAASPRLLRRLSTKLERLQCELVLTPENLDRILEPHEVDLIRRILERYFYAGGRVTKPYTRRNVHESENILSNWLGQFTFILHGDQGTTLSNWLLCKLGQGYAFDSSVIIQFLMDTNFADQRIADIRNTPHAHQPQEEPKVEGMEDLINLDTETLRVYYRNWDVESFIARYQKRTRVSWRPDGRYVKARIEPPKGILFYPPAGRLSVR